jgi:protein-S-isoprenylcysteine O-methyltransferase Ste14
VSARLVGLKVVLFTLVAPGTVTVLVPGWLLDGWRGGPAGGPWSAGALLIAGGALLYAWCAWAFARYGQGTPAPIDPPLALVTRGLYRRTRNPMYLGVLAVLVGEAVWFRSPRLLVYAGAMFLVFHLFTVLYEEPAHRRRFGAGFDAYCREVPRWVPRAW